ncbi:sugar phosphate isomerase/epimerase family protein [Rathayibacter sp. VKM Ac-2754]|uniref:sugar phosphate isomerase/epimerase family protein n=1 Tax=Rathayibacter sp. VKM Ac-2754 TaxID=2609251 RepID=UPI00135AAD74|nr:sugar phosphate isomerase/epimerase [Rathayibacter sp. VKM Ac-2754]MWV59180.1 TIM barrel protein [Rathayibacter sp. VKM Ac-2754]
MLRRSQFALNAIQWINVKADPDDPASESLWRFADPAFRDEYPQVLREIRDAGFGATMLEVLATQTLQDYAHMIEESGLELAPGYASVALPEDSGRTLERGSAEWVHWFDGVRRKAEETNYVGLDTVFLAPEVSFEPGVVRTREAVAVGAGFDEGRLDRVIEILAEAAEVLRAEGVQAGLHNHVGTWVETEHEIDRVLAAIDPALLGASFDIGHLVWAGMDPVAMVQRYSDRLIDLHVKDLHLGIAEASRAIPTPYDRATDSGLFLEPGLGGIDLDGVLAALPADFGGWIIVEVDRASMPPADSARVSGAWLDRVATA